MNGFFIFFADSRIICFKFDCDLTYFSAFLWQYRMWEKKATHEHGCITLLFFRQISFLNMLGIIYLTKKLPSRKVLYLSKPSHIHSKMLTIAVSLNTKRLLKWIFPILEHNSQIVLDVESWPLTFSHVGWLPTFCMPNAKWIVYWCSQDSDIESSSPWVYHNKIQISWIC